MGRFLLLGSCSCTALISYIHVTMQNLHFPLPYGSGATKIDTCKVLILKEK